MPPLLNIFCIFFFFFVDNMQDLRVLSVAHILTTFKNNGCKIECQ